MFFSCYNKNCIKHKQYLFYSPEHSKNIRGMHRKQCFPDVTIKHSQNINNLLRFTGTFV